MISVHVQREGVGQTSRLVRTQDMRVPSAATAAFAIVIMGSVNALMGMEEEHAKPTDQAHTWKFDLPHAASPPEDSLGGNSQKSDL